MASGLPDYTRDIRPRYGGAKDVSPYIIAKADDEKTLATITGKGMIYGGHAKLEHTSTQRNSGFFFYVDEEKLGAIGFSDLNKYGLTMEHCYPIYLTKFDDTNFAYAVGFSHGFTFEKSFKVTYFEQHGTTPKVYCRIIYALI